ncbi:hypothetical protein E3N88_45670 [Mikania micrantha]|uniref:Uncharacterized protein n=1 Tax=Mikania micrantha TaxID=192012 RepID=A0A5N6L8P0_9ASTR|nr:hypothetical protein E3N88_45670 [Mikania micrantha]
MATAGDGNGSAPYENSGAGGKLRKRPFRRSTPATPYARPPTAVRNNNPSMLKKLMDPASRLISSDANRLFDVFRKNLPLSLGPPDRIHYEFFIHNILCSFSTAAGSTTTICVVSFSTSVSAQAFSFASATSTAPTTSVVQIGNISTSSPFSVTTFATTATTGSGLFGFSALAAASSSTTTGGGLFGFSSPTASTHASSTSSLFGSSAPAFGSSPSFGVGPISDTKSGNSTSGSTSSIFGSTWQQPQNSSGFGSTFTSPSSSTFTFGASSTPIPSFATAGASNSSFEGSSVFGNSTPVFGAVPATSPNNNNDQTSMEDSMAEDSMQTHSPVSPFGQAPVSAPGFMFGAATPLQPRQRFPSRSKASRTKHRHFRILSNRLV